MDKGIGVTAHPLSGPNHVSDHLASGKDLST